MNTKIGLILGGCGVMDGSEIHEAVSALIHLDLAGATVQCMAPDKAQFDVVNHLAGQTAAGETRNVLVESARIARGKILPLASVRAADYDGFIIPGGYGAAKNLCDYAAAGARCSVDGQVARLLSEAQAAGKPIGLICIAPVIAAALFGKSLQPKLTIGSDAKTAGDIAAMGGRHENCAVSGCVVDRANRLVTTPAYMEAKSIKQVFEGVGQLVRAVLELARQTQPVG